ncbi:MAG: GGDEF domain-containing protein [Desulfuromusa sp.]|nr:GGDEF domain-containing protein [Desulfuromusa sp.]
MQSNENYHHIQRLIDRELNLPSPPAIAVQILNAVQKDEAALAELGAIISADPSLTAQMLKVANSEIFAGSGDVTNIKRAMTVLGTNTIKNIALSFVIAADLSPNGQTGFDFDNFWRRSITAAVAAELLAKTVQYKEDDIFVAALLQNIGMLVISLTKGDEYNALLKEALSTAENLLELEQHSYGFNHQQVGYSLLANWNLPASISEPIRYHHQPADATEKARASSEILYFSDQLSAVYNESGIAEKARLVQQQLIDTFGIDATQALQLLDDVASNSLTMIETFELDPGEIKPYSLLLQEANVELGKLNLSSEQLILEMKEAKELAYSLQTANNRLKELVYRDGLTGLYNHRYFQEALTKELSRAARYHSSVSLILFDIDYFKKVNDSYGHPAGDLVLCNLARAVDSAVRPSDIVARYGGEEFAVILPETNPAGVKVFAARLRRCIEGIATLSDGQLIYVTVSAGVTTFNAEQPGITKDLLIETADRGLYLSKQNGRNQVTILEPELTSVN